MLDCVIFEWRTLVEGFYFFTKFLGVQRTHLGGGWKASQSATFGGSVTIWSSEVTFPKKTTAGDLDFETLYLATVCLLGFMIRPIIFLLLNLIVHIITNTCYKVILLIVFFVHA
jgi:hypothetical protein